MLTTIFVNTFAVIFALVGESQSNDKKNPFLSFIIIFVFLALRFDFGNDYMNYYYYYKDVHQISTKDLLRFQEYEISGLKEVGYTLLNRLFPSFYLMVAFLSLFSCYAYYKIINLYTIPKMIWFSIFIYIFDPYLMLVQSSAIRQTVAISLFIISIQYLLERTFWKYCLLILLGSLFHKSAIVLLPFFFVFTPIRWNKWVLTAMVVTYLIATFYGHAFLPSIELLARQFFPRYQEAYMTTEIVSNPLSSGFGFIFWSLVFFVIIWSHNKGEAHNILISKISIVGFVLSPIGMYLGMFNRISWYFAPLIIISLPYAVTIFKSRQIRIGLVSILIFWYLYSFSSFFQNPIWTEKFSTYKIISNNGLKSSFY